MTSLRGTTQTQETWDSDRASVGIPPWPITKMNLKAVIIVNTKSERKASELLNICVQTWSFLSWALRKYN